MQILGINYDTGTEFEHGDPSRKSWHLGDVQRDLVAIRDELHCNSVNVYGTLLPRIVPAAQIALREALHVSLQQRTIDAGRRSTLDRIAAAAAAAERLRALGPVTLNLGCETTLFSNGFLPGRGFQRRIANLRWSWPLLPVANALFGRFMRQAAAAARQAFAGPITYSAGTWERVDWSLLDFVGIDLYRDAEIQDRYAEVLQGYLAYGKPVLVTEFGCCAYEGAQRLGGSGWMAVDWTSSPARLKPGHVRNEQVQADVIAGLLDVHAAQGVHGAYVYDFLQAQMSHSPDPRFDLDMAGYGIVKVVANGPNTERLDWEPKAAFATLAARYAALQARITGNRSAPAPGAASRPAGVDARATRS